MMKCLIREFVKLLMFMVLWAFPIYLTIALESMAFLWFFSLSLVVTFLLFSHYEDLAKMDLFGDRYKSSKNSKVQEVKNTENEACLKEQ